MIPVCSRSFLSSSPMKVTASWSLHQTIHSAMNHLKQFFIWLAQTISWSWNVLVDGGAIAASISIETFFAGVHFVSPRIARYGRTGALHVRNWWVELRAAHERAGLQREIQRLEGEIEKLQLQVGSVSSQKKLEKKLKSMETKKLTSDCAVLKEQLEKSRAACLLATKEKERAIQERDQAQRECRLDLHYQVLTQAMQEFTTVSTNSPGAEASYTQLQKAEIAYQLQYNLEIQQVIDRLSIEDPHRILLDNWQKLARHHMEIANEAIRIAIFRNKIDEPLSIVFAPTASSPALPPMKFDEALALIFSQGVLTK